MTTVRYLVYFFLGWSSIADYFIKSGGPLSGILSKVDEAIVLLLLLNLIAFWPQPNRNIVCRTPVGKPIGILLLLCALSFSVNGGSIVNAVQFIFSIVKPIIVFYWIITFIHDDRMERFAIGFLTLLIALQIPFFIYGFATLGTRYVGDYATGATVTGDAYQVAVYMSLGVVLFITYFALQRRARYFVGASVCFVLLAATSTKQIILTLPLIVLIVLRRQLGFPIRKLVLSLAIGSIVFFGIYDTFERMWSDAGGGGRIDFDESNLVEMIATSEKLQGYYSVIFEAPSDMPVPLLGAGPGQFASYTAMMSRTPLATKYIMDYFDEIPEDGGGTLAYRSSGVIALLGDLGILGLVIVIYVYLTIMFMALRIGSASTDRNQRSVSSLVAACSVLILAESLLLNIFEGNGFLLNFFWILAGSMVVRWAPQQSRPNNITVNTLHE